jgi:hypothetical protein
MDLDDPIIEEHLLLNPQDMPLIFVEENPLHPDTIINIRITRTLNIISSDTDILKGSLKRRDPNLEKGSQKVTIIKILTKENTIQNTHQKKVNFTHLLNSKIIIIDKEIIGI